MGYHISILRGPADPIRMEEVAQAIGRMSGRLALDPDAQPHLQVHEPAKGTLSEFMVLEDGELWAKSPSEEFLRLMIELAALLDARVRGDEFETYRSIDETYHHPDDSELIADAAQLSRRMVREQTRRDWVSRFAPVGVFMLIGWIYIRFFK